MSAELIAEARRLACTWNDPGRVDELLSALADALEQAESRLLAVTSLALAGLDHLRMDTEADEALRLRLVAQIKAGDVLEAIHDLVETHVPVYDTTNRQVPGDQR